MLTRHTSSTLVTAGILLAIAAGAAEPAPAAAMDGKPLEDPIPEKITRGAVTIDLQTVATGLTAPNWGIAAPGLKDRLFVTDQDGILWSIDLGGGAPSAGAGMTVFLDASSRLVDLGVFGPDSFDERGLLGVAFHPDYPKNGLLYTYTSEPVTGAADFSTMPKGAAADHHSVIAEWTVHDPTNPASVVDPKSARELMRIDQPQFNHDGGALSFGRDGMLYISLGDGGGADDQDGQEFLGAPIIGHGSDGNGQVAENILGSVIRIDPSGNNSANGQYGIPADNPFFGKSDPRLDEIWVYGLRNPFRFSFDMLTGLMYLADVGQNDIEEINLIKEGGGNYGWRHKEGTFFFDHNGLDPGFVTDVDPGVPAGLVDPIAQYDHDEGLAIIGGFVYRGLKVSALQGRYIFGDFAQTFSNDGRLFYLDEQNRVAELLTCDGALNMSVLGFAQDARGEVYVLANATGIPFGDTGMVLKITVRIGDLDANGEVDVKDLLLLLADWGPCSGCAADTNDDGVVDVIDLLALLAEWGACPSR